MAAPPPDRKTPRLLGGDVLDAALWAFAPYFSATHLGGSGARPPWLTVAPALAQVLMLLSILGSRRCSSTWGYVAVSMLGVLIVLAYFAYLVGIQALRAVH